QPLPSGRAHARTVRERVPLNVADAHTDARLLETERNYAVVRGFRSFGVVPMLRHDEAIGTIAVTRREPGGFTDDEIPLLQPFADQAVIAIENARLLSELQEKNASLSEALDQQTATAEILRVISQSPSDVGPVFTVIAESAARLCAADDASIVRLDEAGVR